MTHKHLVHIVDDEPVVRDSTAALLRGIGYEVELWPLGIYFAQAASTVAPGCILLDYRMPQMDGLAVQRALVEGGITMPIVMLTAHGDIATAVACMKAGAVDFLEKPFRRSTLLAALDKAFERQAATDASLHDGDASKLIESLSAREKEVLNGLTQGLSNKTIARALDISPRTVEIHRARVMSKLKVNNLSGALRIAFAAETALRSGTLDGSARFSSTG